MRAMTPTFCHIEYLLSAVTEDGDYPQTVKFAWDEYTDLKKRASELEAQLTGAAQTIVTLTGERDAERKERESLYPILDEKSRVNELLRADVAKLTGERDEEHQKGVTLARWPASATKERDDVEQQRDAFAAENDAVHRAINEMCGTDTSTIEAVQHVIQERDEALSLRDKVIEECEEAIDERDAARLELQRTITAQAQQLRTACNEVTDDVTRLQWLQSLINEAQKHTDVLSDGDPDAAFTCFFEVQALHDALKSMLNGSNDNPLDEWEQTHPFRGVMGNWRRKP